MTENDRQERAPPASQGSALSPANMRLWNRFGLVAQNGAVTLSLPALDLLLDAARSESAR